VQTTINSNLGKKKRGPQGAMLQKLADGGGLKKEIGRKNLALNVSCGGVLLGFCVFSVGLGR